MADGEHGVLVVVDQEGDQGEGQCHAAGAPADRPRQAVPDGGGGGEGDGGGDHGVRTTDQFEQGQQEEASHGGAGEIEKVDPVDLPDGLADGERDDGAGSEEGQRGGEINQSQVPVGEIVSLGQKDGERQDDQQAIGDAEAPQAGEQRRLPGGHHIGKHPAQSQTEERDGDGEEGEVVVEHHRKDTRESEFHQEGRHGGEGDAQVDFARLSGV